MSNTNIGLLDLSFTFESCYTMCPNFSFNLKNDDIEDDASDGGEPVSMADVHESSKPSATEPRLHTLRDMVRSLALSIYIYMYISSSPIYNIRHQCQKCSALPIVT